MSLTAGRFHKCLWVQYFNICYKVFPVPVVIHTVTELKALQNVRRSPESHEKIYCEKAMQNFVYCKKPLLIQLSMNF